MNFETRDHRWKIVDCCFWLSNTEPFHSILISLEGIVLPRHVSCVALIAQGALTGSSSKETERNPSSFSVGGDLGSTNQAHCVRKWNLGKYEKNRELGHCCWLTNPPTVLCGCGSCCIRSSGFPWFLWILTTYCLQALLSEPSYVLPTDSFGLR